MLPIHMMSDDYNISITSPLIPSRLRVQPCECGCIHEDILSPSLPSLVFFHLESSQLPWIPIFPRLQGRTLLMLPQFFTVSYLIFKFRFINRS